MKLGSKPDLFQNDGKNIRYVANELATDITVHIGQMKFYLHKFPLLSKSSSLQKLVVLAVEGNRDEIYIHDIPGGPFAFEMCAKFCYGMSVTLNAYNVIAARCAAEYLGMHEAVEKGNLIYKIEVFLNTSIFHTWKDSIIVLQTSRSLSPYSEDIKIASRCIDTIASRASVDTSKVDWSYTYNWKKLPEENGNDQNYNGIMGRPTVPKDWWVEDLCELEIDFYERVIMAISSKGTVPKKVVGQALEAFAFRRLPGFSKSMILGSDLVKCKSTVDLIVRLLPEEKSSLPCRFLLEMLKAAIFVESEESTGELVRRIGWQLEEAHVSDLLIRAPEGESTIYNADLVQKLLTEFWMQDKNVKINSPLDGDASKLMVAKLIDEYLAEISQDLNLPLSKFVDLAEMVSGFPRPAHDGLYRAIDMYLKVHPGISKSDVKRLCRLMDCKKLSAAASMHAVQNERLPMRVIVQVLFFEQVRAAASSGSSTPELPKPMNDHVGGDSNESSKSATTTTEEDWDAVELKTLKGELASLSMGSERNGKIGDDKVTGGKRKQLIVLKRVFSRLWPGKVVGQGENSSSDSSGSSGSAKQEGAIFTPSRNNRHSVY